MFLKILFKLRNFWFVVNFPTYLCSLYFHELGHYFYASLAGSKPESPQLKIILENTTFTSNAFVKIFQPTNTSAYYVIILAGPLFTFLLAALGIVLISINFYLGISLWLTNLFILIEQFYFRYVPGDDLNRLITFEKNRSFEKEEQLTLPF